MSKRRDYDPTFPDREEGSLLKTGVAATPLVAGVAYAGRGIASDGSIKQPRESGIDQAMQHLKSRTYSGPEIPSYEKVHRFMQGQSADVNRQAWKWAMDTIDPYSRKRLMNFASDIGAMSADELNTAVAMSVSENTSGVMGRTFRQFQNNINMLKSQEMISGTLPVFTSVEDLSTFATKTFSMGDKRNLPDPFKERLNRIASTLGGGYKAHGISSAAAQAEGLGVWNVVLGSELGEFKIQLPQIEGGVMLEGDYLQTRRIAPDILHKGTKETGGELTRMTRTEFFLKEMEESIAPDVGTRLKTQRDVEQAVKQLKQKVFGEIEAVPNVGIETRTAAQARREAMRGMSVDVVVQEDIRKKGLEYKPGFRRPNDREISELLLSDAGKEMGLRGGVSPSNLMKGRLSTVEFERFAIGPVEEGRRPEQPHRQFQATRETLERLGQLTPESKFRASEMGKSISRKASRYTPTGPSREPFPVVEKAYEQVTSPRVRTTYINPERHAALMEKYAMGEGEIIGRRELLEQLEFEESTVKKLKEARPDIEDFTKIQTGEILGRTQAEETFVLPKGAEIKHVERITDELVKVEMIQKHKFRHMDKLFEGLKDTVQSRKQREFMDFARELGIGDETPDFLASMDTLKKNRALHKAQVISGLEEMVAGTWFNASAQTAQRSSLRKGMEEIGKQFADSGNHRSWLTNMMRYSVEDLGLSAREFGITFGTTAYTHKKEATSMVREALGDKLGKDETNRFVKEMWRTGTAGGNASITYGGPRVEAGVMGSIERRIIDNLTGGAYGETGESLAKEFTDRIAITNPEALITHREIGKTIESIRYGTTPSGLDPYDVTRNFQSFIEGGGGVIRPGHGLNEIYVPSAATMQAMRPFETPTGVQARGGVSDIYHDIAYKSRQLATGDITPQQFQKDVLFSADMLRKEWAPGGKGQGRLTSGKILGSQYLRGGSAQEAGASTAIRESNVTGITSGAFRQQYEEIMESGLLNERQRKEMMESAVAFESGEKVPGMIWRNPATGAFSVQPTYLQRVEGADDLAVIPEIKRNIKIRRANGEVTKKSLTLGPLAGLAGDKDADSYAVALVSPDNQKAIRKNLLAIDSEYNRRYTQHQVRMQLFTPKASVQSKGLDEAAMSVRELMAADVEKLSSGQRWIAPLSERLSETKRALTKFGQGTAAADARFLAEWLEQNPIGAKHLSARQAAGGGLESLMMSITDSLEIGTLDPETGAARLEANINTIVSNNKVAAAMLNERVTIDKQSAEAISSALGGARVGREIAAVDVKAGISEMMRVMQESRRSGYSREGELLTGRGSAVMESEMGGMLAKGAAFDPGKGSGFFSNLSTSFLSAQNKLGAIGRGMIKNHKAIGLGFAGSLALGAALSSPPTTVGSGREKIPNARLMMNKRKAADRMRPEDMQPPQQSLGNPTAPNLVQNQQVRLQMNQPRTSATVSARIPAGANQQQLRSNLSRLGSNTNVRLRDNRSQMHPREIANKLL